MHLVRIQINTDEPLQSRQVVVNYCSLVVFSVFTFTSLYYILFLLVLKNAALVSSQAFKIVLEWSFFFFSN